MLRCISLLILIPPTEEIFFIFLGRGGLVHFHRLEQRLQTLGPNIDLNHIRSQNIFDDSLFVN
jgi:hypothetical protein